MSTYQMFRETGRGSGIALGLWSHDSEAGGLEEVGSGWQGLWSGLSAMCMLCDILVQVWHSRVFGWAEEEVVSEGRWNCPGRDQLPRGLVGQVGEG